MIKVNTYDFYKTILFAITSDVYLTSAFTEALNEYVENVGTLDTFKFDNFDYSYDVSFEVDEHNINTDHISAIKSIFNSIVVAYIRNERNSFILNQYDMYLLIKELSDEEICVLNSSCIIILDFSKDEKHKQYKINLHN